MKFKEKIKEIFPNLIDYYEYIEGTEVDFSTCDPVSYIDLGRLVGILGTSRIKVAGWGNSDENGDGEQGVNVTVTDVMFTEEEGG